MEFKKETIRSFYDTLKRLVELQSSTNDNVNLIVYGILLKCILVKFNMLTSAFFR